MSESRRLGMDRPISRRDFLHAGVKTWDTGARAYLDEAINQGHRAVAELLG